MFGTGWNSKYSRQVKVAVAEIFPGDKAMTEAAESGGPLVAALDAVANEPGPPAARMAMVLYYGDKLTHQDQHKVVRSNLAALARQVASNDILDIPNSVTNLEKSLLMEGTIKLRKLNHLTAANATRLEI